MEKPSSNESKKSIERVMSITIIILFIVMLIALLDGGSSGSGDRKLKCEVCGKSYSYSRDASSNMCSQCLKNYKYAADAAGY